LAQGLPRAPRPGAVGPYGGEGPWCLGRKVAEFSLPLRATLNPSDLSSFYHYDLFHE